MDKIYVGDSMILTFHVPSPGLRQGLSDIGSPEKCQKSEKFWYDGNKPIISQMGTLELSVLLPRLANFVIFFLNFSKLQTIDIT